MKILVSATCTILFLGLALAAKGAETFPEPFGLKWGMSEADLKKLGFTAKSNSDGLQAFSSVSTPKPWSKAETYVAVTYKNKLVKVSAMSLDFTDDIHGTEGKSAYNQLKKILTKKYGEPTHNLETTGRALYRDSDEFYQCLEYAGCGAYASVFSVGGGNIGIELTGLRRGQGYMTVSYESPDFSTALDRIRSNKFESDAEAF